MSVQHKDLSDPVLHEPKGISVALLGQVYEADGAGGGVWKDKPVVLEPAYADQGIESGGASVDIVLSTSLDGTLRSYEDYVAFTQDMIETITPNNLSIDNLTGEFVVEKTGVYLFNFWMSESNTLSNEELGIALFKNQGDINLLAGPVIGPVRRDRIKVATEINTSSISGLLELQVGDRLGIAMASVGSGTITITDCGFGLNLVGAV